jgi:proline iminopeptidase
VALGSQAQDGSGTTTISEGPRMNLQVRPRPQPLETSSEAGGRRVASPLWSAAAIGASGVYAVAAAWVLPRGPLTTVQAVVLLLGALSVGLAAGAAVRDRWVWGVGPVLFVLAYELRWLGVDGPMFDPPPLDSILSVLVLALGRGWLALLVLLPMLVGVAHGRGLSRRRGRHGRATAPGRPLRSRILEAVATAVVALLLVGLVRPPSTPAIVDERGAPLVGSIAELDTIEVGGHEQALLLRGHDRDAPVLLHLEGGPGGTGLGAMRLFGGLLEEELVVVTWDQRGTGKSFAALEPRETLTVDQAVADLLVVVDHLRARFDEDRIYVLGNSWGTTLAVLAAQQRPEVFHALIGTGQMVSQRETDVRMYEQLLAEARAAGDPAGVRRLEELGPPPFAEIADYAPLLVQPSDHPETEWPANVLVSEYSLLEQVNSAPALLETFAALYPQLQDIDFRRDVPSLDVPVFDVQGTREDPARSELADEWLADLDAPLIRGWVVADAGHRPHLQQPEEFARIVRTVLQETRGRP